ncbi:MAG TPA: helix-turn-helix domain-containing protein [Streptosporangiaceae bacterium]|jgi:AraC-like DNA-binding protein
MSVLFRADEEPVVSRVERLRAMVGESIAPIDVRPAVEPSDVHDRILLKEVGALSVTAITMTPATATRTPKLIRRSDPEVCKIDVIVRGHLVVEQNGRESRLGPGDFSFVDLSRPARWTTSATSEGVAVTFPRSLLPLRQPELAQLAAVRIAGDQGTGALLSTLARQLPRHIDDSAVAEGARLGTTVLDLLTVALANRLDRGSAVPRDSGQRALLTRIHAFIEQRLGDPELSPATIAAAHHISVRYLYKLFESQQTTVADWIRRRRLERCRRDLLDPALQAQPVSAIAARWGLRNPAHFNRLFRVAFDMPPGEYRATRVQPALPE